MAVQKISPLQIDTTGASNGQLFTATANGSMIWTTAANVTPAFDRANTAQTIAIAAFTTANAAVNVATLNGANTAVGTGANTVGIAAFNKANLALAASGGTLNGDLLVSGNLYVTGNTIWSNVSTFIVNDPLIYLAGNNYTSDIVDIGFVANYVNATGSNVHTGLIRDAGNKEYYFFQGYDKEPDNNVIDIAGNNFTIAILNSTLRTSNIILNGLNAFSWINSSYIQANSAQTIAIAAFAQANTGGGSSNSFSTIDANGTSIVANNSNNTLAFVPGQNITITGNAASKNITIGLSNDVTIPGVLYVKEAGGNEGGQIELANAVTGSTLSGNVVIDVYQNKLRFFEKNSPNKGAFLDLSISGSGVSSNLLAASSGTTDTTARAEAEAAFDRANSAQTIAIAAFAQANTGGGGSSLNTANIVVFSNTRTSTNANSGAVVITGGLGVSGNIYTANRVGYSNTTNLSVVYTYYNSTTISLDTVFE